MSKPKAQPLFRVCIAEVAYTEFLRNPQGRIRPPGTFVVKNIECLMPPPGLKAFVGFNKFLKDETPDPRPFVVARIERQGFHAILSSHKRLDLAVRRLRKLFKP